MPAPTITTFGASADLGWSRIPRCADAEATGSAAPVRAAPAPMRNLRLERSSTTSPASSTPHPVRRAYAETAFALRIARAAPLSPQVRIALASLPGIGVAHVHACEPAALRSESGDS